jgi:O-antigen/teichoic acid export membrane protein
MSIIKKLASDTALYGVSTILGRFISFALIGLHTDLFEPHELAAQVYLYTIAGVAFVVYCAGFETGYFRFAARNKEAEQLYFDTALSAILMIGVILSGVAVLFLSYFTQLAGYPGEETVFLWMAIIMVIDAAVVIPFARLRLQNRAKKFVAARMMNIFVCILLNIFFLIICRDIHAGQYLTFLRPVIDSFYNPALAPRYIVMANLIANLLFFWWLREPISTFRFRINKPLLKEMFLYSYPILIMNLGAVVNTMTDRLFLNHLLPDNFYANQSTEDAMGIYGQCVKLAVLMSLVTQAFKYSAEPFFFSQADNKNAPTTFALVTKWYVIFCVLLWVGISLNLDLLGAIFLKKAIYHQGLMVVPILLLGQLFIGVYYNLSAWFKLTDKTQYGTYITVSGAVTAITLNFILVPYWGYLGSAISFACSSGLMMTLCYFWGQKFYPVPYEIRFSAVYIISGGLLIYLAYPIKIANLWLSVPFHTVLFLLYALIIIIIERKNIPMVIRKKIKILG